MIHATAGGVFGIDERYGALNAMGDPLVVLNNSIPWENFRRICSKVHDKERKSAAGRKPLDPVMMFKGVGLTEFVTDGWAHCNVNELIEVPYKQS
ncbi:MAG: hypothetical protein ACRD8U_19885, partial [Pyrinomonadaceae bacterium]